MVTKVRKIGNSSGIVIPMNVLRSLGVEVGDELFLTVDMNRVVLTPGNPSESFEDLLAEILEEDEEILHELAK